MIAVAFAALLVGSAVGAGATALAPPTSNGPDDGVGTGTPTDGVGADSETAGVEQFESEAAFHDYVSRERTSYRARAAQAGGDAGAEREARTTEEDAERSRATAQPTRTVTDEASAGKSAASGPDRVSGTNVQERGIDEPDILKTDGRTVFYASPRRRHTHGERDEGSTTVLDISDPADPAAIEEVDVGGRLLLSNDTLVAFERDRIVGVDVSDPESPEQVWEKDLEGRLTAARLYDGEVYAVVEQRATSEDACPVAPLGETGPSVACSEVYRPTKPADVDSTYTTLRLQPETGAVTDTVSVVGSRRTAATYVSGNAVYLSYVRRASRADLMMEYLLTNRSDLLDDRARDRLRELQGYDLSERALRIEIGETVRRWLERVDEDRRDELRKELTEGFQAYLAERKRDLTTTGVVKVGIEGGLSVDAVGEVPGVPLDQFSMDEHDGHLRIATTVEGGSTSENDVYVLDENLEVVGSEQGMGVDQRIFAVRFMEDTAYLVTFRQVDPFHVVDLSEPTDPEELGEVELPGFSDYLHPLGDDRVLGIGEEDGKVKAVVFDVSNPTDPVVEESRIVDDRWSAVSDSHHAFLKDEKHGVFFLPGSEGGYVFSYEDGLELRTRIETDGRATRAMYVNDYLYVFSERGLTVVDETTWEEVDSLAFDDREDE